MSIVNPDKVCEDWLGVVKQLPINNKPTIAGQMDLSIGGILASSPPNPLYSPSVNAGHLHQV